MGSDRLPPIGVAEILSRWQFAPAVTAFVVLAAVLYLWGAWRVRRAHPARPWPAWRTGVFLGGLFVIVLATESGVGSYDDVLFWDHMVQHLLLLMVAPPLLVVGQPGTLLLHASRNPLHTWAKRAMRSGVVSFLTFPAFGVLLYTGTIVGTHLTSFMNLVMTSDFAHQAEHVLYLVAGYLYFLPLLGREPIRWRVSYPTRLFLLFLAMPVDAFTGLALGSEGGNPFPSLASGRPVWAPAPIDDMHIGGAVMWVGGAGLMFALMLAVFFGWSRDTDAHGGLGWLESARRANFAAVVGDPAATAAAAPGLSAGDPASGDAASAKVTDAADRKAASRTVDDDAHLAAYNAYLARLNTRPH